MAKIIDLPKKTKDGRGRFSYSQYKKWKEDRKGYIKQYFLGEPFDGNAYTEFGTKIGTALETGDFSGFTEKEQELLGRVTRLDQFEREVILDLGGFILLGYIDTNDLVEEVVTEIIDYKTGGEGKQSVYRSDDYDQLILYAAALEQETGHLPTKACVHFLERVGNPFKGEELRLGTIHEVIPQKINKGLVKEAKANVSKVASEVSESYKVFNKLNFEIQ